MLSVGFLVLIGYVHLLTFQGTKTLVRIQGVSLEQGCAWVGLGRVEGIF